MLLLFDLYKDETGINNLSYKEVIALHNLFTELFIEWLIINAVSVIKPIYKGVIALHNSFT